MEPFLFLRPRYNRRGNQGASNDLPVQKTNPAPTPTPTPESLIALSCRPDTEAGLSPGDVH